MLPQGKKKKCINTHGDGGNASDSETPRRKKTATLQPSVGISGAWKSQWI